MGAERCAAGGAALVGVGRIGRAYGVRGWVHVRSAMSPPQALLEHATWMVAPAGGAGAEPRRVAAARAHGDGLVVRLEGCCDRAAAERLCGSAVLLPRAAFPEPGRDEYYWVDLLGLEVVTEDGGPLGRVERLIETGAHDVVVVRAEPGADGSGPDERLIPFVLGAIVQDVDLEAGRMRVRWHPED